MGVLTFDKGQGEHHPSRYSAAAALTWQSASTAKSMPSYLVSLGVSITYRLPCTNKQIARLGWAGVWQPSHAP